MPLPTIRRFVLGHATEHPPKPPRQNVSAIYVPPQPPIVFRPTLSTTYIPPKPPIVYRPILHTPYTPPEPSTAFRQTLSAYVPRPGTTPTPKIGENEFIGQPKPDTPSQAQIRRVLFTGRLIRKLRPPTPRITREVGSLTQRIRPRITRDTEHLTRRLKPPVYRNTHDTGSLTQKAGPLFPRITREYLIQNLDTPIHGIAHNTESQIQKARHPLPRTTYRPMSLTQNSRPPLPRITYHDTLPIFRRSEMQTRVQKGVQAGVPSIREVKVKWGEGPPKIRKTWGTVFDPFGEGLPFDPEAPVKMPVPGHQSGLGTGLAALEGEDDPSVGGLSGESPPLRRDDPSMSEESPLMEEGDPSMGVLSVEEHRTERPDVKTTYVDAHCHLVATLQTLKDGTGDETIPQNALDVFVKTIFPPQVSAVVDIHCDLPLGDYHEKAAALNWPGHFKYHFSIGVHPRYAGSYTDEVHESLIKAMSHPSCVAWGGCGIDYSNNPVSSYPIQRAVFARQLAAAVALEKPIAIQTRAADDHTLAIIKENVPKDHRLHLHCFTSGPRLAKAILNQYPNAYIGLSGVITYRGIDHLNEMIRNEDLPVERMLLETNSPYMVPKKAYGWLINNQPLNKKKRFLVSHSGMIPFMAERIVEEVNRGRSKKEEKGITLDELLDITRRNAAKMYGIDV